MIKIVIWLSILAIMVEISLIVMRYIDVGMVGNFGENAAVSIKLVSTTIWLIGEQSISSIMDFPFRPLNL